MQNIESERIIQVFLLLSYSQLNKMHLFYVITPVLKPAIFRGPE